MEMLNSLIEFILPIVELLTDGSLREAPQGSVAANLMIVRYQLDSFQRLLGRPLVALLHTIVIVVQQSRTRYAFRRGRQCLLGLVNDGNLFAYHRRTPIPSNAGDSPHAAGLGRGRRWGWRVVLGLGFTGFDEPGALVRFSQLSTACSRLKLARGSAFLITGSLRVLVRQEERGRDFLFT